MCISVGRQCLDALVAGLGEDEGRGNLLLLSEGDKKGGGLDLRCNSDLSKLFSAFVLI